jgi:hypothetical protein
VDDILRLVTSALRFVLKASRDFSCAKAPPVAEVRLAVCKCEAADHAVTIKWLIYGCAEDLKLARFIPTLTKYSVYGDHSLFTRTAHHEDALVMRMSEHSMFLPQQVT